MLRGNELQNRLRALGYETDGEDWDIKKPEVEE